MRLAPAGVRLAELLGSKVDVMTDCIGDEVARAASAMAPGDVMLLENLRFKAGEKANEAGFAKDLASLGDVYVSDAFGTAHRAHASTEGVTHHLRPALCGRLIEKELDAFGKALGDPACPFIAILGGAKVSDKIPVIENLIGKVDALLIGGAMAYTFLRGRGVEVGRSLVEDDQVELTKKLTADAEAAGVKLLLPVDHVVSNSPSDDSAAVTTSGNAIESDMLGVDIGPNTVDNYTKEILGAGTVVWNGPMGIFEVEGFAAGTMAIARACADSGAVTVIGGGDSVSAVNKSGIADKMTHISTDGGASLELLEGKKLPGIEALTDK